MKLALNGLLPWKLSKESRLRIYLWPLSTNVSDFFAKICNFYTSKILRNAPNDCLSDWEQHYQRLSISSVMAATNKNYCESGIYKTVVSRCREIKPGTKMNLATSINHLVYICTLAENINPATYLKRSGWLSRKLLSTLYPGSSPTYTSP